MCLARTYLDPEKFGPNTYWLKDEDGISQYVLARLTVFTFLSSQLDPDRDGVRIGSGPEKSGFSMKIEVRTI